MRASLLIFIFCFTLLIPFSIGNAQVGCPAGSTQSSCEQQCSGTVRSSGIGSGPGPEWICDGTLNSSASGGSNVSTEFVPLTSIPGVTDAASRDSLTFSSLLNGLFRLLIGLAALLAVVRITIAGVQYMTTDATGSKEKAKEGIRDSLFGMLIILAIVIVLNLINPQILNLDIFNITPGGGAAQQQSGQQNTGTGGGNQNTDSNTPPPALPANIGVGTQASYPPGQAPDYTQFSSACTTAYGVPSQSLRNGPGSQLTYSCAPQTLDPSNPLYQSAVNFPANAEELDGREPLFVTKRPETQGNEQTVLFEQVEQYCNNSGGYIGNQFEDLQALQTADVCIPD